MEFQQVYQEVQEKFIKTIPGLENVKIQEYVMPLNMII